MTIARTESISGRKCGIAAYQAWAGDLLDDNAFPAGNSKTLSNNLLVIKDALHADFEGSVYAVQFLKLMYSVKPEIPVMIDISNCFSQKWLKYLKCADLLCLYGKSSAIQVEKLPDPDNRRNLSSLILQMRDEYAKTIELIEKVLKEKF